MTNLLYQLQQDQIKAKYSGANPSSVKVESLELQEKQQLNQALDNHNAKTAQIQNQKEGETLVRHPEALKSIGVDDAQVPDKKKVDIASEMRLFKNNLESLAHDLGLENIQYQLAINLIKGNFSAQINGGGGGQSPAPPAPSAAPSPAPSAQPTSHP